MYGEHRSDFPVVVVIGDDATFRETLSKLCQSVGLNVLAFDSIAKFLGTKLPDAPTCLVIDVSSPRLGRAKFHAQLARADVQILNPLLDNGSEKFERADLKNVLPAYAPGLEEF